ncbi:MAG: DUF6112 family protein [Propionibacteriaceae bacterium]|nr:DUF6112 family protein [Propionibacteriaceae bacterium]
MNVFPDFDGLAGIEALATVVGALLTIVLIAAVAMAIVSTIGWAVGTSNGNYAAATKARMGLLVALAAAVPAGGGVAWLNWLIDVGRGLSETASGKGGVARARGCDATRRGQHVRFDGVEEVG